MTTAVPTPMTLERLRMLLDAYGAELSRMPEAERAAVQELLARDQSAARLLAEAQQLDALLETSVSEEVSAALRARVAEIPLMHPRAAAKPRFSSPFSWAGAWRFVVAGAFMALLGAASGVLLSGEEPVSNDDGWDDVASIAFVTGIEEEP